MKRFCVVWLLLTLLLPATAFADNVFTYTPIKHATFVLQSGSTTVYVDPVGDAAAFSAFPPPDLILITHIHKDHLAPELVAVLKQGKTKIIGSPTVIEQLGYGTALRNGESTEALGLDFEAIAAYNTTAERLKFHPKGRDNGYVLSKDGVRLYISGDTEDIPEMRNLRDIDIAFVCMNLPFTMTVEQAASAVNDYRPGVVIPYHYRGKPDMSDVDAFERLVTDSKVSKLKWY
jgi:L-ascorbate metabolism protein UlaG (beta-lactamase superfamily)